MTASFWDQRYSENGYAYGTEPNHFLKSIFSAIPVGDVLMVGDGEGRNGVFLAKNGYSVHSVDFSEIGLKKAQALAEINNTSLNCYLCDIEHFEWKSDAWDGIVSIFCHLPKAVRKKVHQHAVSSLRKNGVFVLEAYSQNQWNYSSGGPKNLELLMNQEEILSELKGLKIERSSELEREVIEGKYHTGKASVIQIIGRKV